MHAPIRRTSGEGRVPPRSETGIVHAQGTVQQYQHTAKDSWGGRKFGRRPFPAFFTDLWRRGPTNGVADRVLLGHASHTQSPRGARKFSLGANSIGLRTPSNSILARNLNPFQGFEGIQARAGLPFHRWSFVPSRRSRSKLTSGVSSLRELMDSTAHLSPAQVRAARAWLNWTQDDLSAKSGVSQKSIARYELELSVPYAGTLAKLRQAFESEGISFQFDGMTPKGIRVL